MASREGGTDGPFTANAGTFGRTSEAGFSLRFLFFTAGGLEPSWGTIPVASWVFSSSSSRRCLDTGLGALGVGSVAADEKDGSFLRLRGGPMRTTVLPMPAFEVEGGRDTLSGLSASTVSSPSSSSCIVFLLICSRLLMDFVRDFWEADEDVPATFCFLGTGLGSPSAGVCLVYCRLRFPREGSPDTRELLSDEREITGESVVRLPDIGEVRELLEFLSTGLVGVVVAVMRAFFSLLGADATVSV